MARSDPSPLSSRLLILFASVLCATTVWMAVKLTETKEQILEIPLVLAEEIDEIEFSFEPRRVRVKFGFSTKDQRLVVADNFIVLVEVQESLLNLDDLARREDGEFRFPVSLSRRMVEPLDPTLRARVEPLEVLTPQASWTARLRKMPGRIVPTVVGTPPQGYDHLEDGVDFEKTPELTLVLTAEAEQLYGGRGEPLEIPTDPIDISGLRGEMRVLVRLVGSNSPATRDMTAGEVGLRLPRGVSLLPRDRGQAREVIVRTVEEQTTRELAGLPLSHTFLRQGLREEITPPVVSVFLRGPASAVDRIHPEDISLKLNDVVEQPGTARVSVSARLTDPDLRPLVHVRPEPAAVTITITEDPETAPAPPTTTADDDPST